MLMFDPNAMTRWLMGRVALVALSIAIAVGSIVCMTGLGSSATGHAQESPSHETRLLRAQERQADALEELVREQRAGNAILRSIERRR